MCGPKDMEDPVLKVTRGAWKGARTVVSSLDYSKYHSFHQIEAKFQSLLNNIQACHYHCKLSWVDWCKSKIICFQWSSSFQCFVSYQDFQSFFNHNKIDVLALEQIFAQKSCFPKSWHQFQLIWPLFRLFFPKITKKMAKIGNLSKNG